MTRSRLSDIPGLGPKRIRDLLAHFRSIDAIQLASVESLAAAPGMGPALARQVWEYFHPIESDSKDRQPSEDSDGDGDPADHDGGIGDGASPPPMDNGAVPMPMELAS